jgi:hypothetical protein
MYGIAASNLEQPNASTASYGPANKVQHQLQALRLQQVDLSQTEVV